MLRMVGVGLIGVCGIWNGVEMVFWLRRQAKGVAELEQGISLLRQELELAPEALEQLMIRLEERCEGKGQQLFAGFQRRMCDLEWKNSYQLWKEAVEELDDVPVQVCRLLVSVGRVLGRYGMQEQLETLKIVEQQLRQIRQKMWDNLRQQEKMYWALSVSAGGFLIILLL